MNALGFGTGFRLSRRGKTSVVFDFSAGSLPSGASVARGSGGTCCDASGALASVAADGARFDYDPTSHALKGLLVEAGTGNAVLASRDWTHGSWAPSKLIVSAGTLVETPTAGVHRVMLASANRSLTNGVAVTMSAITAELAGSAKRWLGMTLGVSGFAAQPTATFDLAAGSVTQVANGAAGCVAAPGGWLCWLSAVPNATIATGAETYFVSNASAVAAASYAGDGTSGLSVSEMQFESGAAPTSRIRTAGAAGTRAADAVTLDWGSRGIADGAINVRYGFDDGTSQDVAGVVAGGLMSVPAGLGRVWLKRAEKV